MRSLVLLCFRRAICVLCLSISVVVSSRRTATAQVLYGSLVGSVTDATGASVPDATVKVTQMQTSESREITTSEAGGYTLSTLPAGTYSVEMSKAGFRRFSTQNIEVRLNTVVRVD